MPTARAPLMRAIWPTAEPTAPEAAATTTVSPACGLPISSRPVYAVMPGMPSTPIAVEIGASFGSILARPLPSEIACVCQPARDNTMSPLAKAGLFEALTSLTVPASITPPTGTGWA